MNDDVSNIVSGFGEEKVFESPHAIDFSKATKIERSGTTCDAYITRYQRRRVFIKRLKPELQGSPRHRAAFDKEYDVGVSLKHPSLPEYREIHDDYIVMDFIDGVTLADMIKDNDEWLRNKRNLRKMLSQLVDAIEYLHQHHVVHCDIKADNLMLTHGDRNLMLIDLGNCYTDWLDDSSGTPRNYGLSSEKKGSPDLDYRGIGKIIDSLSEGISKFPLRNFSRFRSLCFKDGITIDELKEALTERKINILVMIVGSLLACVILSGTVAFRWPTENQTASGITSENITILEDSLHKDMTAEGNTSETKEVTHVSDNNPAYAPSQDNTHSKQDYKYVIEAGMKKRFAPLNEYLAQVNKLIENEETDERKLSDLSLELTEKFSDIVMKAYSDYETQFKDIPKTEIQMAVGSSQAYSDMSNRLTDITGKIAEEIDRRNSESEL